MNKIILVLISGLLLFTCTACNNKNTVSKKTNAVDYESVGKDFWSALAKADIDKLKDYYANEVLLFSRSEFLKGRWGMMADAGKDGDLLLKKEKLIATYQAMIEQVGQEKWVEICSKMPADEITFSSKSTSKLKWDKILEKDIIMQIPSKLSAIMFVLRPVGDEVKVVMEYTDW